MTVQRQTERNEMPVVEALQVLIGQRRANEVVITHQGSARLWPQLTRHPLDFHYNPSTMGGAVAFGLGVALADRQRPVIAVTGDGSLLMNLGSLVSVIDAAVQNLSVVLLDNSQYEVTGGQARPGASQALDFAAIARGAGFPTVAKFDRLPDWQSQAGPFLERSGPRFAWLVVSAADPHDLTAPAIPLKPQLDSLRRALS